MILLEGNIGAGKSTLGRAIAEEGRMAFLEEPVEQWQTGFASNLLEDFYNDKERWSFTFQMAAFITRTKTFSEILAMTDHSNVLLERSIYSDKFIFAKNLYEKGYLREAEWQLYNHMWDWLESERCDKPDQIIYLRTPASICHERLKLRGRGEEKSIPLSYLKDLEVKHDEWLLAPGSEVTVIDGSGEIDMDELYEQIGLEAIGNAES